MKTDAAIAKRVQCQQCQKSFISEVQLRIHQKIKHKQALPNNHDNINSSDLSEDQQEDIQRFRGQFLRQVKSSQESIKKATYEASKNDDQSISKQEGSKKTPSQTAEPSSTFEDQTKKVYLCGCQHKTFESSSVLSLHIKKQHNGFPPEGTLYGVSREQVRRQFQPIQDKPPIIRPHIEKTEFICGCGLSYVRVSSLRYHIRTNHNGEAPFGTIGLNKGFEPYDELNGDKKSLDGGQWKSQLQCSSCFQTHPTRYICQTCPEWSLCEFCSLQPAQISQHQSLGHVMQKLDPL